ncbi:MAG: hypothetical protein ABFD07_14090 [Methanobacterium sp.]
MFEIGDHVITTFSRSGRGSEKGMVTNVISYGEATDENIGNVAIEIDYGIPVLCACVKLDPEFESEEKILIRDYQRNNGFIIGFKKLEKRSMSEPMLKQLRDKETELIKQMAALKAVSEKDAKKLLENELK